MTYQYTIPLAPVTKKNHQQILTNRKTGKPFVAQSTAYKRYEQAAGYFLNPKPKSPLEGLCEVVAVFYMPTARRVDLTNLLEALDDVLVYAGVLADDNCNIIYSHDGSRVFVDRKNPRTEVTIREKDDGQVIP